MSAVRFDRTITKYLGLALDCLLFATMMSLSTLFVFVAFTVSSVFACNGYELKDFKIQQCEDRDDVIVVLEKLSVMINKKCEVVTTGCLNVNKQINRGNVSYSVEKKARIGMAMKVGARKNICSLLEKSKEDPEVDVMFKMFDVEQSCPLKAGQICGKTVSVAKHKEQLKMLEGDFEGTVKGRTDAGEFCYKFTVSLVRSSKLKASKRLQNSTTTSRSL